MSEQKEVEYKNMVFTHHGEKRWRHDNSMEWCSQLENMHLDEIYERGIQLTALRKENERLEKHIREWEKAAEQTKMLYGGVVIPAALSELEEE